MKYFRLSYDTRQLSKKSIEFINNTIIAELEKAGFSIPDQTHITLEFPIPHELSYEQNIFFQIPQEQCSEKEITLFRKIAREYFELISLNVGISKMGSYDVYEDEESYQRQAKLVIDNYLLETADYEDENYIKEILDSNQFLKEWLEIKNR
ncbi:hypothetical protein KZ469_06940 [Glaesserella parasuis]|uniref:hypothetical protein n=1 Tax=Pasteurellaceae TaxID=712 RepID=UPI0009501B48|nr:MULTISPECIES: hypothetical protein [Pasteurellaceae]MCT8557418.1 hypothetical protein [Glaesserella parasuis]MCT8782036.1 hypothetical protein [Glaesserella parasuis]MCT8822323.1 hypothetical protein [Glaesserella parasuis]MDD6911310.1 hypothetical protein [Actinobacillus minor]MDE3931395.1 hypothetical protein [Glaesserella parasuis]